MTFFTTLITAFADEFTTKKNQVGWTVTSISFWLNDSMHLNNILTNILTFLSIVWILIKIFSAISNYKDKTP